MKNKLISDFRGSQKRKGELVAHPFSKTGKVHFRISSTNYTNRLQVIAKKFKKSLIIWQIIDNF